MGSGLAITLATVAGVCFFSGIAIISDKGVKHNGETRNHHVNAR